MDLKERLAILRNGGVISSEIEKLVLRVIFRFQDRWSIILTEDNGGRTITHLAMALMRISRKEAVPVLAVDMLKEFKELPVFHLSIKILEDLIEWTPMELPEAEKDYMIVNICLVLDEQNIG